MRIDLHVHSCHSRDSASPVASILRQASSIGLGGIALCDHDTIGGSMEAQRLVEEHGMDLVVVPGVEVTTTRGHLLVLGNCGKFQKNMDPLDIIRLAHAQDCLVVAPHPFKGYPKSLGDVSGLDVDAIETLNSRFILGRFNKLAVRMAEELELPMLGNSDAHFVEMVGRAYTEIDSEPSVDAIFKAVQSGKTTVQGTRTPLLVQFRQTCNGARRRVQDLI
ncbi:MAG: PHP domain-containing protein [ANME-2 cluster archaeon]|nr:PHP domain-containing protein [ANME-2 cluster archaeon]